MWCCSRQIRAKARGKAVAEIYELTRGTEWGFWQGGDGDFGREGEYGRLCSRSGKARVVLVLGPVWSRERAESKQWPGCWQEGWEGGGSQQSKT